jgi:uncharacterized Zn-finger protein
MEQGEWYSQAKKIAEKEGRDLPILASYMDPDPEKFMTWSFEPCARTHEPGKICVRPNGHDNDHVHNWYPIKESDEWICLYQGCGYRIVPPSDGDD